MYEPQRGYVTSTASVMATATWKRRYVIASLTLLSFYLLLRTDFRLSGLFPRRRSENACSNGSDPTSEADPPADCRRLEYTCNDTNADNDTRVVHSLEPAQEHIECLLREMLAAAAPVRDRIVANKSERVYVAVKTAASLHAARLPPLLLTWLQTVAAEQVHVDLSDSKLKHVVEPTSVRCDTHVNIFGEGANSQTPAKVYLQGHIYPYAPIGFTL